jgi:hypothetical protein
VFGVKQDDGTNVKAHWKEFIFPYLPCVFARAKYFKSTYPAHNAREVA